MRLKRLRRLMASNDIRAKHVATITGVTVRRVYGWLSIGQTTPIPFAKLKLLEIAFERKV